MMRRAVPLAKKGCAGVGGSTRKAAALGVQLCSCARSGPTPCAIHPPLLRQIKTQLFKVQRKVSALEQQLSSMVGLLDESKAAMRKAQEAVS